MCRYVVQSMYMERSWLPFPLISKGERWNVRNPFKGRRDIEEKSQNQREGECVGLMVFFTSCVAINAKGGDCWMLWMCC